MNRRRRPPLKGRRSAASGRTSAKLEICLVGPGLRFLSGLSVYTNQLAHALAERHFVSVLLLRELIPARLYPGGHRVGSQLSSLTYEGQRTHDGIDWYWGKSLVQAVKFLRVRPPDVLILQWWTAAAAHTYLFLALLARVRRVPVIIEYHEVQDTGEAAIPGVARYGRWSLKLLTRLASGGLVHHESDLEQLSQVADLQHLVTEIAPHPGYNHLLDVLPENPPELDAHLAAWTASPAERVVLFFGLIRPYKGLVDFIAAINLLTPAQVAKLHFVVCGETWENCTDGVVAARQSEYADSITVINRYVSDAEASALFSTADALILPYKRSSSSGPMALAMSHGLHVIYYDVPALVASAAGYSRVTPVPAGEVSLLAQALVEFAEGPAVDGEAAALESLTWQRTTDSYDRIFDRI